MKGIIYGFGLIIENFLFRLFVIELKLFKFYLWWVYYLFSDLGVLNY